MFKAVAILGLVAGGAGYGLYAYTDLFGERTETLPVLTPSPTDEAPGGSCCRKAKPALSCCAPAAVRSELTFSCCAETAAQVAKKPEAPCRVLPCSTGAAACVGSLVYAIDDGACCDFSARAAVAGPAAVAVGVVK